MADSIISNSRNVFESENISTSSGLLADIDENKMSESVMPKCSSSDENKKNSIDDDLNVNNIISQSNLDCSNLSSAESPKLTDNPVDDVSDLCEKSLLDNGHQNISNRKDNVALSDCRNNLETSKHEENDTIMAHDEPKLNFSLNSSDKLVTLKVSKPTFSSSTVLDRSISYSYENAGSGLRVRMRKITNGKVSKKTSKRLKKTSNQKHSARRHSCDDIWSYSSTVETERKSDTKPDEKLSPNDYQSLYKHEKEVFQPPSGERKFEKDNLSEMNSILLNTSKSEKSTISNESDISSNDAIETEQSANDTGNLTHHCSISNENVDAEPSALLEANEISSETNISISINSDELADENLDGTSSDRNSEVYSSPIKQNVSNIDPEIPVLPNGKLSDFQVETNPHHEHEVIKKEIVEQKHSVILHESTASSSIVDSDCSYNNIDVSSYQKPTFIEDEPNSREKDDILQNKNPVSDFSKTEMVDRSSMLKAYEYHRNKIDMYTNKMSHVSSGQKEKIERYQHKLKKHRAEFSSLTIKLGYSAEQTEPAKVKAALGTTSETALVIDDDDILIEGSTFSRHQRSKPKKSKSSFTASSDVVDLTIDIDSDDGDVEVLEHSKPVVYLGSEPRRKRKRRSRSNDVLERSLFEEPLNLSASSQPSTGLSDTTIDLQAPGPSGISKTNLKVMTDSISDSPNASAKILEILESLDTPAKDYHHIASLRSAFQSVPSSPSANDVSEGAELLAAITSSGYDNSSHRQQSVATNVNCSDRSNLPANIFDHPWDGRDFQLGQGTSSNVLDFSLNNRPWVNNLTEYQAPGRDTLARPLAQMPQVYPDPRSDDLTTPPNTFSLFVPTTDSGSSHFRSVTASVPSDFLGIGPWSRPTNDSIIDVDDEVVCKDVTPPSTSEVQNSEKSSNPPPASSGIDCPICLDSLTELKANGKQLVSTNCGHLFCEDCLTDSLKCQKVCPSCRKRISKKQFHRVYL